MARTDRRNLTADGTRNCYVCQVQKPLDEFREYNDNVRGRVRRSSECSSCAADRRRASRLRSQFNISVEEYDQILDAQGGVCAVCKKPPTTKRLAVDHDHATGLIRGLVCWWCNKLIGAANDDAERLRSASDYLLEPPAVAALGEPRYGRTGRVNKKRRKTKKTTKKKEQLG